jgi:hypothetical protein
VREGQHSVPVNGACSYFQIERRGRIHELRLTQPNQVCCLGALPQEICQYLSGMPPMAQEDSNLT